VPNNQEGTVVNAIALRARVNGTKQDFEVSIYDMEHTLIVTAATTALTEFPGKYYEYRFNAVDESFIVGLVYGYNGVSGTDGTQAQIRKITLYGRPLWQSLPQ
jgi:hypothetical protein